jgi:Transposase DDE domain/Transposase IS66 family
VIQSQLKRQARLDEAVRVWIEGKFGQAKRRFSLARVMTKLAETSESAIAITFFVLNLERWLQLLLSILFGLSFLGLYFLNHSLTSVKPSFSGLNSPIYFLALSPQLVTQSPRLWVLVLDFLSQWLDDFFSKPQIINGDSRTSSKPPSGDLIKRSEKEKPVEPEKEGEEKRRKAGGQSGHEGRTRKGFGRVDRTEFLIPERCGVCGPGEFEGEVLGVRAQEVAQLAEHLIEIVRYERAICKCRRCGSREVAELRSTVVEGQDLGVSLQGMLVWLSHYGHLFYEKQEEWLWELGRIRVGLGTLQATIRRVAAAVKPSVDDLQEWIQQQEHVQVDESPWLVKGVKEWIWVATGVGFCFFMRQIPGLVPN